jgi:hypothetical protein
LVKRRRLAKFSIALERETEKLTPALRNLRTVRQHEGRRIDYETVEGLQETTNYEQLTTKLGIHSNELPDLDNDRYLEKARKMAEELAEQEERLFFSRMEYFVEKAGTMVDAGGRPFEPMLFLDSLEKLSIDFDQAGRPIIPTLIAHPDQAPGMAAKFEQARASPEFQRRWNELFTKKWLEWRDREADRKLVD